MRASAPILRERSPARAKRWAEILARIFGFDLQRCPDCGGSLKIIAVILDRLPSGIF